MFATPGEAIRLTSTGQGERRYKKDFVSSGDVRLSTADCNLNRVKSTDERKETSPEMMYGRRQKVS